MNKPPQPRTRPATALASASHEDDTMNETTGDRRRRRWCRARPRRTGVVAVTVGRTNQRRAPLRLAGALAAMAGIALLAAACGSGSSTPSASASSATGGGTNYQKAVAFAHCMRSHGMPDFPDPRQSLGPGQGRQIKSDPRFGTASADCRYLQPNGGSSGSQPTASAQTIAERLSFSGCMRAHGVPNFPDPNSNGNYDLHGIDPHSPVVKSAALTCLHVLSPTDQQRVRTAVGG